MQKHFTNETVVQIAGTYGKTLVQVIPRRQMQDGYITIPGSSNPDHIAKIFIVFDFELSEQEMEEIRSIDTQNLNESW